MDLKKLKDLLQEQKIFIRDRSKNYICKCPYCNDHPNPKKWGHLWISKNPNIPIAHCFFCNIAYPVTKIISDLTGNKELYKEIYSEEEVKHFNQQTKSIKIVKERFQNYKIPEINLDSFQNKRMYMRSRTQNLIEIEKIPNLIFDFQEFFKLNNLDVVGENNLINNYEFDMLQNKFVGFLGRHSTILYCRNSNLDDSFKFKKIQLQLDQLELMEYYSIIGNSFDSSTVVLSEGNFNILAESLVDSLNIKDNVKLYASCNGFNYSTVLKSVCFDENLYKVDVVILSDRDKPCWWYKKFKKDNDHILNSCKIYMNRSGKDFAVMPLKPFEVS